MGWLKKGKAEGPTEIVKLPVIYGHIYEYDLKRLRTGDKLTWVLDLTVELGGEETEHRLRLDVEVR